MASAERARLERTPEALRAFVLGDPLCRRLAALAEAQGQPIALVGGWVRDWLAGRPALDWDLVVPGDPRPLVRALVQAEGGGPLVTLDESFGIYRTRLRNGLSLDFAQAVGGALEPDLARRDLTVNAMAVRLADGALLDPHGGLADLAAGVIRAPSRTVLADDPLRLVRVYRFAATLGFAIDPTTTGWVAELAPTLARSAGERILAELAKLFASGRAADALAEMARQGLLVELVDAGGAARVGDLERRLADPAWSRAAAWASEEAAGERARTTPLMLAALLTGGDAAQVGRIAARLRWSRKEDMLVRAWVLAPAPVTPAVASPRATHRFLRATGEAAPGHALLQAAEAPAAAAAIAAAYFARLDAPLPRLVDGHDLMRALGLPPGRHIAALLADIEEAQALGELGTREEALAWAARKGSEGV